ncbi:TonB-dependent receptor plug domain-containing protein, partial [Steroidobacter sp.]|uniref:TonB-dependent receptor plug domain-containing protein n=1 Tax=Steroidobacter sp. TaxID=1978227 RepID=UPI001A5029BE
MNQNAVVLLALGLATHAAGAQAQDVPSGAVADDKSAESFAGLEEVVVTARFKEERLQTIGLSAVALSGESLRDAGASTFQDIAGQMAGLNLSDRGPNRIDVSFRGMANVTEGNDWQRSTATVGIYLDDVSVVTPFPTQRSWNMFDVSRVEVVRGPQGTLYGEGAMGGAVRFVTQDPSLERFEGRVAASWGSYSHSSGNNWRGDATFSMPLIDDVLGLRLTAFKQDDAGFIDFTGAGVRDANSFESSGGRIVLLAKPSENLRVRTSVTYEDSDLASEWKVT